MDKFRTVPALQMAVAIEVFLRGRGKRLHARWAVMWVVAPAAARRPPVPPVAVHFDPANPGAIRASRRAANACVRSSGTFAHPGVNSVVIVKRVGVSLLAPGNIR